jgi:hypothetical protein
MEDKKVTCSTPPVCISVISYSQPGIVRIFQELWGTEDLIASFDGMNASLPINAETGRTDIKITKAWPRKIAHLIHVFDS